LTGRSTKTTLTPEPTRADNGLAPLDRLDAVLAQRDGLRVRFACPSQEFAEAEMAFGTCRWLSCSRGIWESLTLGLERDLAMVMLQAPRIGGGVLDYLFSLLPAGRQDSHDRHALVEIDDARDAHLSEKVLSDKALVTRLRSTADLARTHGHQVEGLSCYASSTRMAELADRLGVYLIDAPPALLPWGRKSGSRQVFREAGIRHPVGSYQPDSTLNGLARTLNDMTARFGRGCWMVKTDDGFGSGHGNAVISTADHRYPLTASAVAEALRPCTSQVSARDYLNHVTETGAIVEQVVTGGPDTALRYPSAIGYLTRGIDSQILFLTVHDQILGTSGDYRGCGFPASTVYRTQVAEAARTVLNQLAALGVTGHVGVDFIALVTAGRSSPDALYATEINLRQTGTTHPHRIVRALVPGTWNPSGTLTGASGHDVCYTGTDSIIEARYRGISSEMLIGRLRRTPRLAFDPQTGHGAIPHLWPALQRCGKIGATFVAASAAGCDALERDFRGLLDDLAGAAEARQ
jgi:hypothetical protein